MNQLDGVINLDKPAGISSAQAVYRVREITGVRKCGHAGTLDPRASGVLVLCLGKATKLVESVMDHPKVYRTTARLDVTSATLDLDAPLEPVEVREVPSPQAVADACRRFEGRIQQIPPKVSAIKQGGKPAYLRLRMNQKVVLAPREIDIYWLYVHRYEWPVIDIEVCSGRGTYIRALARDLGAALGAGGCLTNLLRLRVGPFARQNACSLETLAAAADCSPWLVSLDQASDKLRSDNISIPPRPTGETL